MVRNATKESQPIILIRIIRALFSLIRTSSSGEEKSGDGAKDVSIISFSFPDDSNNCSQYCHLLPPLLLWTAILSGTKISWNDGGCSESRLCSRPIVAPQEHIRTSRILPRKKSLTNWYNLRSQNLSLEKFLLHTMHRLYMASSLIICRGKEPFFFTLYIPTIERCLS